MHASLHLHFFTNDNCILIHINLSNSLLLELVKNPMIVIIDPQLIHLDFQKSDLASRFLKQFIRETVLLVFK